MSPIRAPRPRSGQAGAAAIEFALVASIFFMLLIGIAEFSRVLFYWNTAGEATRLGARIAVVCDVTDTAIKDRMTLLMPLLKASNIQVAYEPSGCDADADTARNSCRSVTVSVANVSVKTFIPVVPITVSLPPFTTTLPRESLDSSTSGKICN
ncbi:TadE/TadG family type IV pilus assembly protein [Cupriavidus taiwanensis]|uniref:Pseudopilin n=2 Tax=Cupriavidus taiwanensis TaxID=164546 RepID=B3R2Y9_CUPTR|nr:TadE/TadG family type IV pilus assembly protein [Cupriavidus taiwanensis]CAQ68670.1 putative pseudopilin [Cupriavidus taiwanensis LMG 19424]SOY55805.1 putative pseudopilin [Cupriavidus taiwanensis]SOY86415.1 putative pseudopilin [Cupriavidus taiwanensis]SOZ01649.1 putative pseudopilin [Cupriavidus taiwanensis]SOZ04685.1 putative pseudopilin [Cupriavidus taiwanensis]